MEWDTRREEKINIITHRYFHKPQIIMQMLKVDNEFPSEFKSVSSKKE